MKDQIYKKVGALVAGGHIRTFDEIATDVQKKTLGKDMHMHFNTLAARAADPGKWTIHQLAQLADLLEVDAMILLKMAYDLRVQKKKEKK